MLHPSEPELVRFCRNKSWRAVTERSKSHPSEAIPMDSAVRGESSTALSIAVRSRAPVHVLDHLLHASMAQVGVIHFSRGSVLHDALRHRASDPVLDLLVRAATYHNRSVQSPKNQCILGRLDDLGRTPLHYMVDRVLRILDRGEQTHSSWSILRSMVELYPGAVSVVDADGTTPLVLLLLIPRAVTSDDRHDSGRCEMEHEVYCMVDLMLSLHPKAAQVSRRLPRPWHYHFKCDDQEASLVHGNGVPSPLSCALLYGRSIHTVDLLIDANRRIGVNACRSLVTHHREVPLHIAASMRCSVELLEKLVQEDEVMLNVEDIHGLRPFDWIWIRHVLDWCSSSDPFASVMVSRRRYINNNFVNWYQRVSNQYLGVDRSMDESPNQHVRTMSKRLKKDLLERVSVALPKMINLELGNHGVPTTADFSLVHAAACVPCPLAMVAFVCDTYPSHLQSRESRMGRLPLHYAATRSGYTANYPVGVSCNSHKMQEISPLQTILARFQEASRVTDNRGQLALHIAIDYAKAEKARHKKQQESFMEEDDSGSYSSWTSSSSSRFSSQSHQIMAMMQQSGHQEIGALLHSYPESLSRRDGTTKLFPFQQAAEGSEGDLELCFMLLRRDPSFVLATSASTTTAPSLLV